MWWLPKVFVSRMREICAEVSDAEVWVSGTMPVLWECYECRDDGASVGEVPVGVRGDVNRVGSDVLGFRGCRRFRGSDAKFVCQSVGRVAWPSWAGGVARVGGWPSWAGGPRGRVALVGGWPLWAGSGWMVLGLVAVTS